MIMLDLSEAVRGCERIQRRLAAIEHVMDHAEDLMKHWRVLMEEGNLRACSRAPTATATSWIR